VVHARQQPDIKVESTFALLESLWRPNPNPTLPNYQNKKIYPKYVLKYKQCLLLLLLKLNNAQLEMFTLKSTLQPNLKTGQQSRV
jgi:hypothetical protein